MDLRRALRQSRHHVSTQWARGGHYADGLGNLRGSTNGNNCVIDSRVSMRLVNLVFSRLFKRAPVLLDLPPNTTERNDGNKDGTQEW